MRLRRRAPLGVVEHVDAVAHRARPVEDDRRRRSGENLQLALDLRRRDLQVGKLRLVGSVEHLLPITEGATEENSHRARS